MVGEEHRHYCLAPEGLPGETKVGCEQRKRAAAPRARADAWLSWHFRRVRSPAGMLPSLQTLTALGETWCKQGQERPARSPALSASPLCCIRQTPPISCGEKWGLTPWRDWKILRALIAARLLHPCPAASSPTSRCAQHAACPFLLTGTATLPQCSEPHCHSGACSPELPAPLHALHLSASRPPVPCAPTQPAPPASLCARLPPPPVHAHPGCWRAGLPTPRSWSWEEAGQDRLGCRCQGCPWMPP